MLQLETERLILRNGASTRPTAEQIHVDYKKFLVEYDDSPCPFEVYQDLVLYSYLQANQDSRFGYYNLLLKEEERVVGYCNFRPNLFSPEVAACFSGSEYSVTPYSSLEIEIGWSISKFHRKKGYATESAKGMIDYGFKELKVKRIVAFTELSNVASVKVMEKLNMKLVEHPENQEGIIGFIENCQL